MPPLDLARGIAILLVLLAFATLPLMHDDRTLHASPWRRHGLEALRVALLMQVLLFVAALFSGDDMDRADLVQTTALFQFVGLGAWAAARVSGFLARRAGLAFAGVQAVEFVSIFLGIALGRLAANAVEVVALGGDWLWRSEGLGSMFFQIELMLFTLVGGLVASIRLLYHVRLYAEQQRHAAQETTLLRLREQATRAQLESIQARINPHFLYNALGSLAGLIHDRPDEAEAMTLSLARLFRAALDVGSAPLSTVRQEVALAETYLAVEAARFGPRLATHIDVAPDALDVPVPRFLLQPLVENAVRHGVATRPEGGTVRLHARREAGDLVVAVRDDGPPFPDDLRPGYGLESVRESLALLYPGRHTLLLENGPDKGVRIVLPAEGAAQHAARQVVSL